MQGCTMKVGPKCDEKEVTPAIALVLSKISIKPNLTKQMQLKNIQFESRMMSKSNQNAYKNSFAH